MKLTRENALWYKDKVIEVDEFRYMFSVEGPKADGRLMVTEMTVDVFEDGEWSHELSNTYYLGDTIDKEYNPWVLP